MSALSLARPAAADPAPARAPDPVIVELYREARELVNAGRWDEACPKFEQAKQREPTAAILVNVGDCHAHQGKLAKAMEDFDIARELNRETPDEARRTALAAEIDQRVKKLGPRIPRLRVIVENPVAEMVVRCDGERLDADEIGIPVPLDPGVHVLTAQAAGFDAEPQHVTLKEGEQARVTLRFTPRPFVSQHKLSLGLALGGVALAGAGAGLAAWTTSSHAELSEICRTMGAAACRSTMADLDTKAILTNVAFAAAGVAAVSAVLVLAVAERPQGPKVQASIRGTFATVGVAW